MALQTYDRLTLANQQLETAIKMLVDEKNYLAAITLAGAAEEILGNALKLRDQKSALEDSYVSAENFHQSIFGAGLSRKDFIGKENAARNALKHLQADWGPTVDLDLRDAACWMIVRAVTNCEKLGVKVEGHQKFDNWFGENIVGM